MSLKSSEINNCSWSISTVLESSFYLLLLLPSILSTYRQTNEESVGTDSEDFLSFSDAHVVNDEEDTLLSSILHDLHPCIFLSVSIWMILDPPFCNRLTLSFPAILKSICGLPMMVLPLVRSMAFSCSSSFDDEKRICKDVNSSFDFWSVCSCKGTKHLPHPQ